ncbi:MAG: response regulator, partial [Chloroflexi bacterium]
HILSQTIQQIVPPALHVALEQPAGGVQIALRYPRPAAGDHAPHIDNVIIQLMQQIGWKLQHHPLNGQQQIIIQVQQPNATILIIDDNEGLVNLLERYFSGHTYQVLGAHSGEDGLRLAQQVLPDAIIMDLMMPGMDGWELLQRLQTSEETRHIPVIICSVINDPELAYSLGASKFVNKPVNKEALLNALQELNL